MVALWLLGLISISLFKPRAETFLNSNSLNCHSKLKLFTTENHLVLSKRESTVSVKYVDTQLSVIKHISPSSLPKLKPQTYDAIYGFFKLPLCSYVVVVTSSKPIEGIAYSLQGIRTAEDFEFIKIPGSDLIKKPSVDEVEQHRKWKNQLLSLLKKQKFHFSTNGYDITMSFQKNMAVNSMQCVDYYCDNKFFWNFNQVRPLLLANASDLVNPMCSGWIRTRQIQIDDNPINVAILARRAKTMQGTRFLRRGGNVVGEVANCVEIEQVLQRFDGRHNSSFLQIRGSIPLQWSQSQLWPLKSLVEHSDAWLVQYQTILNHYRSLISSYNLIESKQNCSLLAINLIDKAGSQGVLGLLWLTVLADAAAISNDSSSLNHSLPVNSLSNAIINNAAIKMELGLLDRSNISCDNFILNNITTGVLWFDYHKHCHGANVSKIISLYQYVDQMLQNNGIFHSSYKCGNLRSRKPATHNNPDDVVQELQMKLIRTNCMDCLDRTNVVQSAISRWALIRQLETFAPQYIAAVSPMALTLLEEELELWFRTAWTDLGDFISHLYAGSRAMKRDVTKTGKRTSRGMMDDAVSFAKRYITNTYQDHINQRGIDLLIGSTHLQPLNPIMTNSDDICRQIVGRSNLNISGVVTEDCLLMEFSLRSYEEAIQQSHSNSLETLLEIKPARICEGHRKIGSTIPAKSLKWTKLSNSIVKAVDTKKTPRTFKIPRSYKSKLGTRLDAIIKRDYDLRDFSNNIDKSLDEIVDILENILKRKLN